MSPSLQKINHYWSRWVKRRALAVSPHRFDSGNLYIIPSSFGWAFFVMVVTLFLCAINYQVSSVFLLTFLLMVAGMLSAWEAHFNLKGLSIHCMSIEDAYQNEAVKVVLWATLEERSSYALECFFSNQEHFIFGKVALGGQQLTLWLPGKNRGCFKLPRITFRSYFPLGLFRVWGYVYLDENYYVYPKSISPGFWPEASIETGNKAAKKSGNEEIYELKPVINPWGQPGRIAWKIAARGQGWYVKTMVNPEGSCWLFRVEDLPPNDVEQNLQHLCYWLQTAEQRGYAYGLELKGVRTDLSQGPAHLTFCLRQLAIY